MKTILPKAQTGLIRIPASGLIVAMAIHTSIGLACLMIMIISKTSALEVA